MSWGLAIAIVEASVDLRAFLPFVAFADRGCRGRELPDDTRVIDVDDLTEQIDASRVGVEGAGHDVQFAGAPFNDVLLALWRRDVYTKEGKCLE
jgi:hypothetical protein